MTSKERIQLLKQLITQKILLLDGATGTALQAQNLTSKDFGGAKLEGCNEALILHSPQVIQEVHHKYLEAGADIIETNSFGGTPIVLAEYGLEKKCYDINFLAAQFARKQADHFTRQTPHKPRFVAGSIGPTTKAISVTGGITFQELIDNFSQQAQALYDGGIDYFLVETCQDTRNIKAAIIGIEKMQKNKAIKLPIAVSVTIEPTGTMLAGQDIDALITSLAHFDLLYLGLNCATGPDLMTEHIRTLATNSPFAVSCLPNAGLPDEEGNYLETPKMMARVLERFLAAGWLNIIGGCCGTTYQHIAEFSKLLELYPPHKIKKQKGSFLSGIENLEINDEKRPILVGERTNVIGSKKFRNLIANGDFDTAAQIAKNQVKKGAAIIDVCLANPDRDEHQDMQNFLEVLTKQIKAPLMIDSTNPQVVEMALSYSQGKSIINSINLEDGTKRFEEIIPLVKKFGAALVVGTIDEDPNQGMAVTRQRKLEIATRAYQILTEEFAIPPTDIYWDPLVFPCATGDENYLGSAQETIEGLKLIKKHFPLTKSILGISNVSFGLPSAGREVLNSVFLYHCTQAGLDLAIVNTQKLRRYSTLTAEEIELAENLLFNRGSDPVGKFATFFRNKKSVAPIDERSSMSIEERLAQNILEGSKEGLIEDLDTLRQNLSPLEIINGPLMSGMAKVGELFNKNQLIVAEVLQSAEVMKSAVAHLEQFMDAQDINKKGKILIATVKGDVHDIGKNLVDIVLSNNGFEIIDLGIKINSKQIIEAYHKYHPDIIGLSGLLVKSAQQMILTAEDLRAAGITVPIVVGGAALSKNFVNKKLAPVYPEAPVIYAKDAMNGLELVNKIVDPQGFAQLKADILKAVNKTCQSLNPSPSTSSENTKRSSKITLFKDNPAPDYKQHTIKNSSIDEIFHYINPLMLYGRHLGINGKIVKLLSENKKAEALELMKGDKALEIFDKVEKIKQHYKTTHLIPQATFRFFKANSQGNEIFLYSAEEKKLGSFHFPRQHKTDGLSLADYVLPYSEGFSTIALFAVTVGKNIKEEVERLKKEGEFLASHALAAIALESAEAYAELIHSKIRSLLGIGDRINMTMLERFQAKYQGKRYSFGYPACPDLDNQKQLFSLLNVEQEIGVKLTEGNMMDPEASVTAIVFQHPQATYFSVGNSEE